MLVLTFVLMLMVLLGKLAGGVNPTFTFQHPSTDEINASSPSLLQASSGKSSKARTACEKVEGISSKFIRFSDGQKTLDRHL